MIYVSICIPTKNRLSYLKEVINSIKFDGVSFEHYQIVVSDNSDNDKTQIFCEEEIKSGINIKYYKNTKVGFYNSINSLLLGDGEFLKLHNDYSKFKAGAFKELIKEVVDNIELKPVYFFSNEQGISKPNKIKCESLDSFVSHASYLITWSSAFSVWKSDLEKIPNSESDVDSMFPHTSLLMSLVEKNFIIYNNVIMENIHVDKKGGYNIFYNFCILFLDMIKKNDFISNRTYKKVKKDLFFKFIVVWYFRSVIEKKKYSFDNNRALFYIGKKYGPHYVVGVILISYIRLLIKKFKIC